MPLHDPAPLAKFDTRDLADMATTAGEIAIGIQYLGKSLGDAYAEGRAYKPAARVAAKVLREARERIGVLIAELDGAAR